MAGVVVLSVGALAAGCFLTNIAPDSCNSDVDCVAAFGSGAKCHEGFCAVGACVTGHDCRSGGGACVAGKCVDKLPADPAGACTDFEPANLLETSLMGPDAPIVVGGMFFLDEQFGAPMRDAAKLAIRQINEFGALNGGRKLAMAICDNYGETKAAAYAADNKAFTLAAVDYLAETLGVPFAVGPLRSADSVPAVDQLIKKKLPTLLISPSATSALLSGDIDKLAPDELGLFWRTPPSDELQATVLAHQVVGKYPTTGAIDKVVIAYLNDEYGAGFQKIFQLQYQGTSVPQPYKDTEAMTAVADRVAAEPSDAVLFVEVDFGRILAFIEEMAKRPELNKRVLLLTDGSKNQGIITDASAEARAYLFKYAAGTAPAPEGSALFNTFQGEMKAEFDIDPKEAVFTEHTYDAMYAGAGGLVWASQKGNVYDGRQVAQGLLQLTVGAPIDVGGIGWANIKAALTGAAQSIDITGVSGNLDWNESGEVKAPIEIWMPDETCMCLKTKETVTPTEL